MGHTPADKGIRAAKLDDEMRRREKIVKETGCYMDDLDENGMFNTTHTDLLVRAFRGEIDVLELAKMQLANRGLDHTGKWVGFDKAREIAKTHHFVNNGDGKKKLVVIPQ